MGAKTPIAAFAATAASTALPPRASIIAPICDASGCSVATMPCLVITIERVCERSAAPAGGQKTATVSKAKRILEGSKACGLPGCLEKAEPFRDARIECVGNVEVAAGIKA